MRTISDRYVFETGSSTRRTITSPFFLGRVPYHPTAYAERPFSSPLFAHACSWHGTPRSSADDDGGWMASAGQYGGFWRGVTSLAGLMDCPPYKIKRSFGQGVTAIHRTALANLCGCIMLIGLRFLSRERDRPAQGQRHQHRDSDPRLHGAPYSH